jgi:hypothetical protein
MKSRVDKSFEERARYSMRTGTGASRARVRQRLVLELRQTALQQEQAPALRQRRHDAGQTIVLCSDVDAHSGPLTVMRADTSRSLRRKLHYRRNQRVQDEQAAQALGSLDGVYHMTGSAGTLCFVDTSRWHVSSKNLSIVFRKTGTPVRGAAAADAFDTALAKHVRSPKLTRRYRGRRRLWWLKRSDDSGHRPVLGRGRVERLHWAFVSRRNGYTTPRSMIVTNLHRGHTSTEESPLEIQFPGEIRLFYK